jgi:type IV fimbrial biogenesis protein FimT
MKPHDVRGVTLLELIVGLAILAVLGTLALPSMHGRLARERLGAAAEALAGDLADARFEAARRGAPLHVDLTLGDGWCWSVAAVPGCACGVPQGCQIKAVRAQDHPGVRLVSGRGTVLDAQGFASGPLGATFDSAANESLRVDLGALGRARVCALHGPSRRYAPC